MNKILFPVVTSVNKWLGFPVFVLLTGLVGNKPAFSGHKAVPPGTHPFHVSTTEINHNAENKTLEISCRVFTDDFESCLAKHYKTKVDLSSVSLKKEMDSLVSEYLGSHLRIQADGKTATLNYLGFEREEEAIYAYFEAEGIATVKKMDITNSILYDLYEDQISIMHITVNGSRKSTKLDYPDKQASFSF